MKVLSSPDRWKLRMLLQWAAIFFPLYALLTIRDGGQPSKMERVTLGGVIIVGQLAVDWLRERKRRQS
jgi:hypothetical protein